MMLPYLFLFSFTLCNALPFEDEKVEPVSYVGHKLLRLHPISTQDVEKILSLDGKEGVNFWSRPNEMLTEADILLSPEAVSLVKDLGIKYNVLQEDISELLSEETKQNRQISGMNWRSYRRYSDILNYCQSLARQQNGDLSVTIQTIGKSVENRDIVLMKISNGGSSKPGIWLDGGMHAREWVSPATVTYILDILVNNRTRSKELLDAFDWYIVPVANVDGYEYTHTVDRMWRKNRARTNSNRNCRGVDMNRNYDYIWGGAGSSADPCSEVYRGPSAFSELETKAMRDAILARRGTIKMYLSVHAYSQLLLIPWSGSRQKPQDYNELHSLAVQGTTALERVYGTKYRAGTAPDLIYVATGGSDDWAKGKAGIKYSYTFELRDTGRFGFLLPPNQIIPSGEETFEAVRAMALSLKSRL